MQHATEHTEKKPVKSAWFAPKFDRKSLKEALAGENNPNASDLATGYS